MSKQYPIAEARDQLARLVHEVETGPPVELTRRGKPVAVLVSVATFRRISEGASGFWDAYQKLRGTYAFEDLDIDPAEVYADVQDRAPGRDFSW